ncbi:MAG: CBS domain-containing protein [Candidatus Acididesulfobacter diazotrophicus]|uniref:CBS domain-containing protein n=1 Tax=Candidatus Acididesulfobacter diazotrophicus TaxID=2597226 RepID=A0A519BLT1_9DELT|nr:MAG: CBS domain-containing protein [Candidatus Acididesulfobacter diazotrophicus]
MMNNNNKNIDYLNISDEDIRIAFKETINYIDITEEDFKHIFQLAFEHAKERLLRVTVGDIMIKNVVSVNENSDIDDAIRLLSDNKISGMPVLDDNNAVKGFIAGANILSMTGMVKNHTFKDILRHLLGEPFPHANVNNAKKVKDIMNFPVITISPDIEIKQASQLLLEKRIKKLPVIDANNKLIGIISAADIIKHIGER